MREGGAIDIEVQLDRRPGPRADDFPLRCRGTTAQARAITTSRRWKPSSVRNQTSVSIQIEALDDNLNDDLEYLELRFGEPAGQGVGR